jgi:hypothetical protein
MTPNFHEIFERFDTDEQAIRYIQQQATVKGFFIGAFVMLILLWALS